MAGRKSKPTDRPVETAARKSAGDVVVETKRSKVWAGVVYQRAWNVKRGPGPERRTGPYWRAYWHDAERNKTRSKYIGKEWRELGENDF